MEFSEPQTGGRLNPRDIVGHLLLVWPVDYLTSVVTKFTKADKPSDAIVVDVVDLDQPDVNGDEGALFQSVWWLQSRLIQALKNKVGSPDPMLAWMDQGVASPGMNSPFILTSATGDPTCVKRAEAWAARHPDFKSNDGPSPRGRDSQPQPQVEGEQTPQDRQRSHLERMARMAVENAERLPKPPGQEQFPY